MKKLLLFSAIGVSLSNMLHPTQSMEDNASQSEIDLKRGKLPKNMELSVQFIDTIVEYNLKLFEMPKAKNYAHDMQNNSFCHLMGDMPNTVSKSLFSLEHNPYVVFDKCIELKDKILNLILMQQIKGQQKIVNAIDFTVDIETYVKFLREKLLKWREKAYEIHRRNINNLPEKTKEQILKIKNSTIFKVEQKNQFEKFLDMRATKASFSVGHLASKHLPLPILLRILSMMNCQEEAAEIAEALEHHRTGITESSLILETIKKLPKAAFVANYDLQDEYAHKAYAWLEKGYHYKKDQDGLEEYRSYN